METLLRQETSMELVNLTGLREALRAVGLELLTVKESVYTDLRPSEFPNGPFQSFDSEAELEAALKSKLEPSLCQSKQIIITSAPYQVSH